MIRTLVISVFILCVEEICASSQCNNCVLFRSCPSALEFAEQKQNDPAATTKLKESFCGTQVQNGVTLPKICCSNFESYNNRWATADSSNDAIENHQNVALLPESCGTIDGKRIHGGEIANLHEFPWMALISHKTRANSGTDHLEFKCAGSIINERYILTAAHCVQNKKIAGVRIGEFDIRSKEDCQGEYPHIVCESHIEDIRVEEEIVHENYKRNPIIDNDIALLRLKNPIKLTFKNAKPICLPIAKQLINLNITSGEKIATVAGWGLTETGRASAVLRKVSIPILTEGICQDFYSKNPARSGPDITSNKLCAGEAMKDSCNGDSGGPLMLEDEVKGIYRTIQYGIVSFGPKQCGSAFPGVYTDVTKYMKWILDHIKP